MLLWNFCVKCKKALAEGFKEYCAHNCINGFQYLVKPNYHPCERCLWLAIFLLCSIVASLFAFNYMTEYSQNVYRITKEAFNPSVPLRYPAVAVCPIGEEADAEMLTRIERIFNSSLYKEYPELRLSHGLKDIFHMLTFQNLYDGRKLKQFLEASKTFPQPVQKYLQNLELRNITEQLTYSCEEVLLECSWLEKPFSCCSVFLPVVTSLGTCFLFNSKQTEKTLSSEMIAQIEMYNEPYKFKFSFTKAAEISIENPHDVPQKIMHFNKLLTPLQATELTLGFKIDMDVTDASLLDLDENILGCRHNRGSIQRTGQLYASVGFTACITEKFFKQQFDVCKCINVNGPPSQKKFCNFSGLACLEQRGFLNMKTVPLNKSALIMECLPNCESSRHIINEKNIRKILDAGKQNVRSVQLFLSEYPSLWTKRKSIRQSEDKLADFSNILSLLMGLNFINIIEFVYLTWCAFCKYNETTDAQAAAENQQQQQSRADSFDSKTLLQAKTK